MGIKQSDVENFERVYGPSDEVDSEKFKERLRLLLNEAEWREAAVKRAEQLVGLTGEILAAALMIYGALMLFGGLEHRGWEFVGILAGVAVLWTSAASWKTK